MNTKKNGKIITLSGENFVRMPSHRSICAKSVPNWNTFDEHIKRGSWVSIHGPRASENRVDECRQLLKVMIQKCGSIAAFNRIFCNSFEGNGRRMSAMYQNVRNWSIGKTNPDEISCAAIEEAAIRILGSRVNKAA